MIHFGNDHRGDGGIAAVIRQHLHRQGSGIHAEAVATYDQAGVSFLKRNLPFVRALWRITLLHPGRVQVVHIHMARGGSYFREGLILWSAWLRGHRNTVVTMHGSSLAMAPASELRLLEQILRPAKLVHVLDGIYRDLLGRSGISSIRVVPNDVEVSSDVAALLERSKTVLFLGEIGPRKGVDVLLESWARLQPSGWLLRLAGSVASVDGPDLVARAAKIPNVVYEGLLSPTDVRSRLLDSRVIVLPSRAENFPMAVCEGLAAGCVVTATSVGAVPTLLGHVKERLFAPGSGAAIDAALSSAVSQAMTDSGQAEAELNHQFARANLSTDALSRTWYDLYLAM